MKSNPFLNDITIWLSIIIIALIDFNTPLGYSIWQPYIAVLLLTFWSERKYLVYIIAVVCTVLIICDYLISPRGIEPFIAFVNNLLAIIVLWIVAILCAMHKKALSEIKKSNIELELKINERTEELNKTVEQLKESNTELEHFAYVASHDLQEPLRMITSYISLFTKKYEGQLDKKADDCLIFIKDGASRMQLLINDLLKYARLTTRQMPLELTDCNKVIDEIISDLQLTIKETDAEVKINRLPTLMADSTQIRQLFQNLIGNALKFHSELKPFILISAERRGRE
ncbi:MAG: sensor histidine kinase [Methanococcaceae archaeon]